MCGIFGIFSRNLNFRDQLPNILSHRGPDSSGVYTNRKDIYLSHNRLSIIGLDSNSNQPMKGDNNIIITFNGEIYNYQTLKKTEVSNYSFKSNSDTEVILALYEKHGVNCVNYLRGMFAFAIWDENKKRLFCARDRFGIKPFYFNCNNNKFIFASEMKALLPFLDKIETNKNALLEYFAFQYTLGSETLFQDIQQLMPGHFLIYENDQLTIKKYWDMVYQIDYDHSQKYFEEKLYSLLKDSISYHQVSDVPIGSYLSGGIDSSLVSILACEQNPNFYGSFHGMFNISGYDESDYAQIVSNSINKDLYSITITAQDFINNISKVIYHLDTPVAGPGAFPQYMVSKLASKHVKVILGGQGGDELFGGYARYVIAYFEQCIKASIEGTYKDGNFIVTPESIIPNLTILQEYKPLIKYFWQEGLFDSLDKRYLRLINRANDLNDVVNWQLFDHNLLLERFKSIFNNHDNVAKEAYFDKMTHFDFKCLLPALLHVEDRMSMAHGVESRVPFLDHPLVEFIATIPADIKFSGCRMKNLLKAVFKHKIPKEILCRRDKMGFPVPLKEWFSGEAKEFLYDILSSQKARTRDFYDPMKVLKNLDNSGQFSRKIWGILSLELWHREFHDKSYEYFKLTKQLSEIV